MRVICVNTGDKYDQWYTDNLKHMVDNYSGLEYDSFEVIDEEVYGGVYDKLQMFDKFREGQNIYFDLDVLIKGDCNKFITKELTVCHAWWRKDGDFYKINPINSSIISWEGNRSGIFKFWNEESENLMKVYDRGIDQYLYEVYKPATFTKGFCSFQTIIEFENKLQKFHEQFKSEVSQGFSKNIDQYLHKVYRETDYNVYLFNQTYQYMKTSGWWSNYFLPQSQ